MDFERSIEVGDEFNKILWGDFTIQVNHYKSGNKLEYVKNNEKKVLLDTVKNFKISGNKFYVVADSGYAIADWNNVVRIYTFSDEKVILDKVIYLTSYDAFDAAEQKILKELK